MSLILLLIDILNLYFWEPSFAATWLVKYIFGFSGVVLVNALLWWLLAVTSIGLALKVHLIAGAVIGK